MLLPINAPDIRIVSLEVTGEEGAAHIIGAMKLRSVYLFENRGKVSRVARIGFPITAALSGPGKDARAKTVSNVKILIGGNPVELKPAPLEAVPIYSATTRYSSLQVFELRLMPGERREVVLEDECVWHLYEEGLIPAKGGNGLARALFEFFVKGGATWDGDIETAKFKFSAPRLPAGKVYSLIAFPEGYAASENEILWSFEYWKPREGLFFNLFSWDLRIMLETGLKEKWSEEYTANKSLYTPAALSARIKYPGNSSAWRAIDESVQLWVLRNEIYARHGYIFKNDILQDYFSKHGWYKKNPGFTDTLLNLTEQENIKLIVQRERDVNVGHKIFYR